MGGWKEQKKIPLDKSGLETRSGPSANGSNMVLSSKGGTLAASQVGTAKSLENQKLLDESSNKSDEHTAKIPAKNSAELKVKASAKRSVLTGSLTKTQKQDPVKDDGKSGKAIRRTSAISVSDRDVSSHTEGGQGGNTNVSSASTSNGNTVFAPPKSSLLSLAESKADIIVSKPSDTRFSAGKDDGSEVLDGSRLSSRIVHSPRHDSAASTSKSSDKLQKRTSPVEETDRLNKHRKGDVELKDQDGEVRLSDRERSTDPRSADFDKPGTDELTSYRAVDKHLDRAKEKGGERHDGDYRERLERSDKSHADDILTEKSRDISIERFGRKRSVRETLIGIWIDSVIKLRMTAVKMKQVKYELLIHLVKCLMLMIAFVGKACLCHHPYPLIWSHNLFNATGRRDDDPDRRLGSTRHTQRLSPRHEEKERRRSEENCLVSQDDGKRRREDDFRERKLELSMKAEERESNRERDREKANLLKEDVDATVAKRRKLKREHLPSEPGEYSLVAPPPAPHAIGLSQSYDGRDRDRKGAMMQRGGYLEEPGLRIHGKEAASKMARRDTDPMYDREWDDVKRQRAKQRRRHRK